MTARTGERGFTLVEVLVGAAIMAVFVAGLYAAFLQSNQYAARVRLQTAAKIVLERAVNSALSLSWTKNMDATAPPTRPLVLQSTNNQFQRYDLDGQGSNPTDPKYGRVDLYLDPTSQQVVTGILYRNVLEVYNPGTSPGTSGTAKTDQTVGNSDGLVRVTFRLQLDPTGATSPTTYYSKTFYPIDVYTLRARD